MGVFLHMSWEYGQFAIRHFVGEVAVVDMVVVDIVGMVVVDIVGMVVVVVGVVEGMVDEVVVEDIVGFEVDSLVFE